MPDWLRRELQRQLADAGMLDGGKLTGQHRLKNADGAAREWNADPFTLVLNAVCWSCNNGWSRRLEDHAKPHLQRIISGDACSLDRDAQATLGAWCFKTACIFDHVGEHAVMPREYMDSFYRDRELPAGVFVHLARRRWLQRSTMPRGDDGDVVDPIAQLKSRSTTLEPWQLGISKTVIILGEMVAQVLVFSPPSVEGTEVLAADAVRIWPYNAALDWPNAFSALTVEDTVGDVVVRAADSAGHAQSVHFVSPQQPS